MRRFLVDKLHMTDGNIVLSGDLYHHIVRVLRLRAGSPLLLADGKGCEYEGKICRIDAKELTVTIEKRRVDAESALGPRITLFQGLPKGDKMELILQKCTELGAAGIAIFRAARSVTRPSGKSMQEKLDRWQRIALEAARQSNRVTVPEIGFEADLTSICRKADQDLRILLWEGEEETSLRHLLSRHEIPQSVAVMVGPEGGLTEEEVAIASGFGFVPVSLGSRILRTETAGMAVIAVLQFQWGDLG